MFAFIHCSLIKGYLRKLDSYLIFLNYLLHFFRLVYDRETGKPKGYGFCEYKDQETALSAMRNLNGYEIGGRTLRVDNACTEKSRLEMQCNCLNVNCIYLNLFNIFISALMLGMPTSESYYGDSVKADKAPEIINNVISTLPPEQLYDLMKQMKECVQVKFISKLTYLLVLLSCIFKFQNNPVEARNMLLQNPQLGYALLQAQVVMKIVEPEVAKVKIYCY